MNKHRREGRGGGSDEGGSQLLGVTGLGGLRLLEGEFGGMFMEVRRRDGSGRGRG